MERSGRPLTALLLVPRGRSAETPPREYCLSSDSAASGRSKRCARTAPLPGSRSLPRRSSSSSAAVVRRWAGQTLATAGRQSERAALSLWRVGVPARLERREKLRELAHQVRADAPGSARVAAALKRADDRVVLAHSQVRAGAAADLACGPASARRTRAKMASSLALS